MSAAKRGRSETNSEDGAAFAKVVKISHDHDGATAHKLPAPQESDQVNFTIELYPSSETTVNDAGDNMTQDGERKDMNGPGVSNEDELRLPDNMSENSEGSYISVSSLEQINGFVNVCGNRVAYCNARLIRRHIIRKGFWADMVEFGEQSSSLAFELFDRHGRFHQEYYQHPFRKGLGIWDIELDYGDILLLEKIDIKPLWRRQGVGTKLISAILEEARSHS
ncbi:hypothetical protein F4678DRAFT_456953 [Xylaria arbuscula]|nr:hypothetical protein F4678DRAFT_456953 [Xylaria arbuscula]